MEQLCCCFEWPKRRPHYKQVGEVLEDGTFVRVCEAVDQKTQLYVTKKTILFDIEDKGLPSSVLRDISVMKELEHENVVRLLDVMYKSKEINLYFEWLGGNLLVMKEDAPLSSLEIKGFLFQILNGVCYCHTQKVLHRNLHPGNLVLGSTGRLKLANFGWSTFDAAPSEYTDDVGTLSYQAPEILLHMQQITPAVDMWSVGCIFAEMASGKNLFDSVNGESHAMANIIRILGVPSENEWPGVTAACTKIGLSDMEHSSDPLPELANLLPKLSTSGIDLLSKMLRLPPDKRISAHDALAHPYFRNSN